MKIGKSGEQLIKHFESCKLKAYRDSVGVWTIGWGHTKTAKGGMIITEAEAEELFEEEIVEYENYINRLDIDLTQNQFDALVSWVYNLGPSNLEVSTMKKRLLSGDYWDVPAQIRRWDKAGGKTLLGLTRRRNAEALLFADEDWREYDG